MAYRISRLIVVTMVQLTSLLAVGTIALASDAPCTNREQFLEMMMRMGLVQQQTKTAYFATRPSSPEHRDLGKKVSDQALLLRPVGKLVAEKKYSEACAMYRQAAKQLGFDLDAIKILNLEEREEFDKSAPENCKTEARINYLHEASSIMTQQGKLVSEPEQRALSTEISRISELEYTDLAAACKAGAEFLARVKEKYGRPK